MIGPFFTGKASILLEFDSVSVLRFAYAQHKRDLEVYLKDYLSSASLREYEIEHIYTVDEKIAMEQGEKISPLFFVIFILPFCS